MSLWLEVDTFLRMFIPRAIAELPSALGSITLSLIPFTPVNLVLFTVFFILFYIFGYSTITTCSCTGNKSETKEVFSLWTLIKNTYMFYLPIAVAINYTTLSRRNLPYSTGTVQQSVQAPSS